MFHFAEIKIDGVRKCGLYNSKKNTFILDIGTQSEIIFYNADKLPDFNILEEAYNAAKKITKL